MRIVRKLGWLGLAPMLLLYGLASEKRSAPAPRKPFKQIGGSFSLYYAGWLHDSDDEDKIHVGPPWQQSLDGHFALNLSPMRLSTEWVEIEQEERQYDFSDVETAIKQCAKKGIPVILPFGVKTPRWPEHHIPEFYEKRLSQKKRVLGDNIKPPLFAFLKESLKRYGSDPRVLAIQVENEPFEATGDPETTISYQLLREEVALARSLTKKPILLTVGAGLTDSLWEAKLRRPGMVRKLLQLKPDWIGLNLYQRGFGDDGWSFDATDAHWELARKLAAQIRQGGATPIITELQMEPWEANPAKMQFRDPLANRSFKPEDCRKIYQQAETLGCETVLLWGLEFQLACHEQGNDAWLKVTRSLLGQ